MEVKLTGSGCVGMPPWSSNGGYVTVFQGWDILLRQLGDGLTKPPLKLLAGYGLDRHRVLLPVRVIRLSTNYTNGLGIGKVEFRGSEPAFAWRLSGKPFRKNHPQFTRPRFEPRSPRPRWSGSTRLARKPTTPPRRTIEHSCVAVYFYEKFHISPLPLDEPPDIFGNMQQEQLETPLEALGNME
ncbi:unnamed protein product [Timema podura]|uniref:Uncharacterized protein n=1 Tax=Timema podura TaxID=61482 RepID=A0ABN7NEZ8_TIMPD|nr:unnamed protein product [Timema podura]